MDIEVQADGVADQHLAGLNSCSEHKYDKRSLNFLFNCQGQCCDNTGGQNDRFRERGGIILLPMHARHGILGTGSIGQSKVKVTKIQDPHGL